MIRVRLLALAVPLAAVVLAGSALAYVCHPLSAGARMLTLDGAVRSLGVHGNRVEFVVAGSHGCSRVVWNTASGARHSLPAGCAVRSTQSRGYSLPVSVDKRGRPVLHVGARMLPLPAIARSATASNGIAIVDAVRPDSGVFAVRLRDGAFTYLAPNGHGFAPRIDTRGVVLHDGENKRALRAGRTLALFVPRRAIVRGLAKTGAPMFSGAIRGLSMDGLRVVLTVHDPGARCDRVLYWNVAWAPVQQISAPSGPTCLARGRTRLGAVAVGGFRAEWLASSQNGTRLIAGSPLCQEWVVRRLGGQRLAAVAADGATIAYATTMRGRTSVGIVGGNWRARELTTGVGSPLALAADQGRVAVLWSNGRVEIRNVEGLRLATLRVGHARALALEGSRLVVLRGSRLDVYDVVSHRRVGSFEARGATGLDLQYGVAAFARGRDAVVLDTATGRTAVVGEAPRRLVGIQIEGPGLAYAWTNAQHGVAQFVTTAQIDRALGR